MMACFDSMTGTSSRTRSSSVLLPNSLGTNLFTPAATAASTKAGWRAKPSLPTIEITASWPWKAFKSDAGEKSDLITLVSGGKVAVDSARDRTDTLKMPEPRNAESTGTPMLPLA